jgi:hypothetical protein
MESLTSQNFHLVELILAKCMLEDDAADGLFSGLIIS